MRELLAFISLLVAAPLAFALDVVAARGQYLVNKQTHGIMTMNGIWYSLSNSTTDATAMDPLTNAEACTRDAALMAQLGINTIYVITIDPKENHDQCFSIFNSVGIYIMLMLRKDAVFSTTYDDLTKSYKVEFLKDMFEIVDAVKDYENLLGFDLGVFPSMAEAAERNVSYGDAQKLNRAFVRDVKEYIAKNAHRPILVGGTLNLIRNDESLDASDLTQSHVYYSSCAINGNANDTSRADYVAFYQLGYGETDPMGDWNYTVASLARQIDNATVPTWLSMYGVSREKDLVEYELTPQYLNDTIFLYNSSTEMLTPAGPYAGGARYEWTNVNLGWKSTVAPISNWGIVITDASGNVQLTENYERLREIFSRMNTGNWLSGNQVGISEGFNACRREDMVNTTAVFDANNGGMTTLTIATDWQLPTRPAGLDALITSGVGGKTGQMVDVTVTTIVHTVRDSKGSAVTSLVLKPSKSRARSTTSLAAQTGGSQSTSPNDNDLSKGSKIGIGIGAGVGGLLLGGALVLLTLRRRHNKKIAASAKNDDVEFSDGSTTGGKYEKAELATGSDVEAQPSLELPADKEIPEVPGNEEGGGSPVYEMTGGEPTELPVREKAVELPVTEGERRNG